MDLDDGDEVFPIVGVGASAGGLGALRELLGGLSGVPDMAIVIVQHLDPNHKSMMASLIEKHTEMTVRQIEGDEPVECGHVYVIPPGQGLRLADGMLQLVPFETPRGLRRPIDDFLESLGRDRGGRSAGVILSGTGADGSRGVRAIKEHGGIAIAQEPDEAEYDGMPLAAAGTGLMDYVMPARKILPQIRRFFSREDAERPSRKDAAKVADHVDDLCGLLQDIVGHDFSGYKRSTLERRIQRRMQVLGLDDGRTYLETLRGDNDECSALFRDLLINVTRFFRDEAAFDTLRENAIEPMVRNAQKDSELRIWVAGCSSGEEAYSIAMMLRDEMERQQRFPLVSIFATDIDEQMLSIAREGTYPIAALADIPEDFRDRFTIGGADHFTILPQIRDMVRFSAHSLIKDPPFSRLHLISCRNLLIYFDDRLQQAVIPIMHYALRPDGLLFLGPSETTGRFDDLFDPVVHRARLYRRRAVRPAYPLEMPAAPRRTIRPRGTPREDRTPDWIETEALAQMTQRHAPASLLVDPDGAILANWGPIGRYFDFPSGAERRRNAAALAKPGLREVLGALLRQADQEQRPLIARDVSVRADFGTQEVRVICEPVRDRALLVVIKEQGTFVADGSDDMAELSDSDDQARLLESEVRTLRHRLRTTVEELETANEELKSSNEEMMSMNEELQSTNEELTTVNDELNSNVEQLSVANADLRNVLESTQLVVVILGPGLELRSFTSAAAGLFGFSPADRGRMVTGLLARVGDGRLPDQLTEVIRSGDVLDTRLAHGAPASQYALRIMPYRQLDGSVDGAVMVLTDIAAHIAMADALSAERERLNMALGVAEIGTWDYDPATRQVTLDARERALLDLSDATAGSRPISAMLAMDRIHPEDRETVGTALDATTQGGADFVQVFRVERRDGGWRWLRGMGRAETRDGRRRIVGVSYDVTTQQESLRERELHLAEMSHRIKNLFAVVGALISNAEKESVDKAALAENLRGRVSALNRAHMLMVGTDRNNPVPLDQTIDRIMAPALGGQQVRIGGDAVMVPSNLLTPLVLILHEWVTNSTKYGALSRPDGRIEVSWHHRDGVLRLAWQEWTGTAGSATREGFGSRLIRASVLQLSGEMTQTHEDGLLSIQLTLPLAGSDPAMRTDSATVD